MLIQARGSNCAGDDMIRKSTSATHTLTTTVQHNTLTCYRTLKTSLLFKCLKAVLGSPVCRVQTLGGDMGHRYTFYRYVDRSSREDLYER